MMVLFTCIKKTVQQWCNKTYIWISQAMIRHVDLILDQLNDINKKSFLFLQNTDF